MAKDIRGQELKVGQLVARAYSRGRSPALEIVEVTRVSPLNDEVYLDDRKIPVIYTDRMVIIREEEA
jgi:hypothetical protein